MTFIKRIPAGSLEKNTSNCVSEPELVCDQYSHCVFYWFLLAELNLYTFKVRPLKCIILFWERQTEVSWLQLWRLWNKWIFFCCRPQGWNEMISHAGADMSWFVIFRNRDVITDDKMQYLVYLCLLYKKVTFSVFSPTMWDTVNNTYSYKTFTSNYPELWLQRQQTGEGPFELPKSKLGANLKKSFILLEWNTLEKLEKDLLWSNFLSESASKFHK